MQQENYDLGWSKYQIISYLKDIVVLEREKMIALQTANAISKEINLRQNVIDNYQPIKRGEGVNWLTLLKWYFIAYIGIIIVTFPIISIINSSPAGMVLAVVIEVIIFVLCGVIIKKRRPNKNKEFEKEKQKAEIMKKECREIIPILQNDLDQMKNSYNQLNSLLREVYAKNIIYPTYRYMVACGMFVQYLESGRCNTLGEAYNLYEDDLKYKCISSQLNDLKQGQKVLLNEVQNISDKVNELSESVKKIEKNTGRIARNSAISAHCNVINTVNISRIEKHLREGW